MAIFIFVLHLPDPANLVLYYVRNQVGTAQFRKSIRQKISGEGRRCKDAVLPQVHLEDYDYGN